jgi:hypothetical protein
MADDMKIVTLDPCSVPISDPFNESLSFFSHFCIHCRFIAAYKVVYLGSSGYFFSYASFCRYHAEKEKCEGKVKVSEMNEIKFLNYLESLKIIAE